ncbi:MAG: hypothetical protein DRI57_06585 [Deltaproteobacteria bacterium]|nr:MAG: hypothetical protein DRI57_06585 [Deltaproteobacteria bacterium]
MGSSEAEYAVFFDMGMLLWSEQQFQIFFFGEACHLSPLPACRKMFSKITNINTPVLIIRKKMKPEGCRKILYVETKKFS